MEAPASALRTTGGDVFTGLHLAATVARVSICAEAVALAGAVMAEANGVDTIATVHHAPPDEDRFGWVPVSPCGMCRELLSDYAPGLIVLVPADQYQLRPVTIESLLPTKCQRPVNK